MIEITIKIEQVFPQENKPGGIGCNYKRHAGFSTPREEAFADFLEEVFISANRSLAKAHPEKKYFEKININVGEETA